MIRIVIAVDGSDCARRALEAAGRLARDAAVDAVLLNVREEPVHLGDLPPYDDAAATAAASANEVEPADGSVDFLLEQQWQIRLQHEPARRVDMARRLVVPASVRLRDGASVELHAPLAGRLVAAQGRALPRAGERVKAGETLALVEPPLGADTLTAMHTLRLELEMQLLELGLGVEGVDVRRAAFHHQKDAPLGLGGQLLWTRSKRPRRRRVCPRCGSISLRTTGEITGHHRREGHAAKRGTESVEGITPPYRLALLSAACRRPAFSRHRQTRCC